MEPSVALFETVLSPTAVYAPSIHWNDNIPSDKCWEASSLNPKNRIDSFAIPKCSTWRLDGVDVDGTRYFALPLFAVGQPPLRIDVYTSSQDEHLNAPQQALYSNALMPWDGGDAARSQLSRHILRALIAWSSKIPDFESIYNELPFGSRIVIDTIRNDIHDMEIHVIPIHDVERSWFTPKCLQETWQLRPGTWPKTIDIGELSLQEQPHEAISLVCIPARHGNQLFVFKSLVRDTKHLYHELKVLLSNEAHPNITSPPHYIVLKKCRFGGKLGVCGFILTHYAKGNLANWLSYSQSTPIHSTTLRDRFRWSIQITEAIIHVNQSAAGFYPDLKPDNVVLHNEQGTLNAVLIDFEQRGGWYSWSPPEVAYVEYLEHIAARVECAPVRVKCVALLRSHIKGWKPPSQTDRYHSTPSGFSSAWLSLDAAQREPAQVFMLGKLLWCIFENMGSVNCGIGIDMLREVQPEHQFPRFRQTPAALQRCIQMCTAGAPEWEGRYRSIRRYGSKLVPVDKVVDGALLDTTAAETQQAAKEWWRHEVRRAKRFLQYKTNPSACTPEDCRNCERLVASVRQRPSLAQVLETLKQSEDQLVKGIA